MRHQSSKTREDRLKEIQKFIPGNVVKWEDHLWVVENVEIAEGNTIISLISMAWAGATTKLTAKSPDGDYDEETRNPMYLAHLSNIRKSYNIGLMEFVAPSIMDFIRIKMMDVFNE